MSCSLSYRLQTCEILSHNIVETAGEKSIWWTWTASVGGRVTLSTEGSGFDTILSVYRGSSVSNLTWVVSDDDSGSTRTSRAVFDAAPGEVFKIAVSGYRAEFDNTPEDEGSVVLRLTAGGATPPLTTAPAGFPRVKLAKEAEVKVLAVQADGKVIAGGLFTGVTGQDRTNLARLNPNGSVDQTWAPVVDGEVNRLLIFGNDLFVAGNFRKVNGIERAGLVKISLADGMVDPVWNPRPNGTISGLAVTNGHLFVGGAFTVIGGLVRTNLAKIPVAGIGQADAAWDPRQGGKVNALVAHRDTLIVAGSSLVRLSHNGAGAEAPGWNPQPTRPGPKWVEIYGLLIDGTNIYFAAGSESSLGFEFRRAPLAEGSGLDPNWRFGCCDILHPDRFKAMAVADGRLGIAVEIGVGVIGPAHRLYNVSVADAAQSAWQTPLIQSPSYISDGRDPYADRRVSLHSLAAQGNQLLVAGNFSSVNGLPTLCLAAVDPISGELNRSFTPHFQRPGAVWAVARQPDGKVVIGGEFSFADDLPRGNLARFNEDGSLDPFWFPGTDGAVTTIKATENALFLGGLFRAFAGVGRQYMAKMSLPARRCSSA